MSWNDQALTTVLPGEALLKMPIPRRQAFDWLCCSHTMAEGGAGGEMLGAPLDPQAGEGLSQQEQDAGQMKTAQV